MGNVHIPVEVAGITQHLNPEIGSDSYSITTLEQIE